MAKGNFINHDAASAFMASVKDPIIRGLIQASYTTMLKVDCSPEGDFDLLYFFRIMELYLRDREGLSKALMGNFDQDKLVWGDD